MRLSLLIGPRNIVVDFISERHCEGVGSPTSGFHALSVKIVHTIKIVVAVDVKTVGEIMEIKRIVEDDFDKLVISTDVCVIKFMQSQVVDKAYLCSIFAKRHCSETYVFTIGQALVICELMFDLNAISTDRKCIFEALLSFMGVIK